MFKVLKEKIQFILPLVLPIALPLFFLWWFSQNHSFFVAILYLVSAFYFYFRPFPDTIATSRQFLFSFLLIVLLPFFTPIPFGGILEFFYLIAWGALFFSILRIKSQINGRNYQILNNFLLLIVFIIFFSATLVDFFALKFLLFYIAVFFLIREFLGPIRHFAAIFSFLIVEIAWAEMFLPIGFLNLSALLFIIVLALKNIVSAYFSQAPSQPLNQSLSRNLILKNITFIIIFGLIIFMASKWGL